MHDAMPRDRYFALRSNLKVVEDDLISAEARKGDRLWKARPMLDCAQTMLGTPSS